MSIYGLIDRTYPLIVFIIESINTTTIISYYAIILHKLELKTQPTPTPSLATFNSHNFNKTKCDHMCKSVHIESTTKR